MLDLIVSCVLAATLLMALAVPGLLACGARPLQLAAARSLDQHLSNHRVGIDAHLLIGGWLTVWTLVQLLTIWLSGSVVVCICSTLFMLWLPRRILGLLSARRRQAIERALPDALAEIAAAIRAGSTATTALQGYVAEHDGPLGQEFAQLLGAQRLGTPFHQALEDLGQRVESEEMDLFLAAVAVATDVGGQLADTLERLSVSMRRKHEIGGRISALTAQGVMQGRVILLLPYCILGALLFLDADAMQPLVGGLLGWITLAIVLLLQISGVLMIRRITRISV